MGAGRVHATSLYSIIPDLSASASRKTASSASGERDWKKSRMTCMTYSECPLSAGKPAAGGGEGDVDSPVVGPPAPKATWDRRDGDRTSAFGA